ncbi:MAG TPA: hypothetical protein VM925_03830 [Labilithrix sp.]|nr:hypothetical protein [Labilithrix sp.]
MDYATVARRLEAKQADCSLHLSTTSMSVAGGVATYSGRDGYANRACAIGLDGPVTSADVERLIHFFESRGEEAKVELSPFAHESLVAALGTYGFVVRHFVNALVLPLGPRSVAELAIESPPEVVIERLERSDEGVVRAFAQANERAFAAEGSPVSQMALDLVIKATMVPTNDSFIARTREGRIVGVASSESSDGLTLLFGGAVIPSYRRRGLQRALMITRLAYGILRGSDLACVCTPPGRETERNAARLGFSMAYTRVALRRPLSR